MYSSFRLARFAMSGGNRLDLPEAYNSRVWLSANVLITRFKRNLSRDACQVAASSSLRSAGGGYRVAATSFLGSSNQPVTKDNLWSSSGATGLTR